MGTNCAPLLADLFLFLRERLFRQFSLSYRYIDDLISFSNKRFKEFISDIYPKELTISETTESTSVASYLYVLFTRDENNNITNKLYDKRDAFGFHIVKFPFMSSNIPSAPALGVYASQLSRYARCCSNCSDFLSRHRALVTRRLSQGYKVNRSLNIFEKFYSRHTDPAGQYKNCLSNVCGLYQSKRFFPRFFKAELKKLAKMASVMHEADHAYSIQSTWLLHRLATDVPSIACVINSKSIFVYNLNLSNFL